MIILADGGVDAAHASTSSAVSVVVALLALALAVLALRAKKKRANPALAWVAASFFVFGAKNVFSAIMVPTHLVQHDDIELVLSLFDLAILVLLFVPLLFRRRGGA